MNHENSVESLENLPIEELRKRAQRAIELAAELKALFPDLIELSELERKYSQGRMRRGEPEILVPSSTRLKWSPLISSRSRVPRSTARRASRRRVCGSVWSGAPFIRTSPTRWSR